MYTYTRGFKYKSGIGNSKKENIICERFSFRVHFSMNRKELKMYTADPIKYVHRPVEL